jgi:ribose/xylose/arabinose/galactoside ABC-type transport system permease subunit/ABC-type multidrug transport system ATPase subunit
MLSQLRHLPRTSRPTSRHVGGSSARVGLVAVVILIGALVQMKTGNFITRANISTILINVSSLLIAGVAAARLLVSGSVDLSIGGQFSLIGILVAYTARDANSLILVVCLALAAGAALGALNGYLVRFLTISPLIVTLGLSFIYSGFAYTLARSQSIFGFSESFTALGREEILDAPLPVWIALALFVVGSLALTRTVAGVRNYAIGGNVEACGRVGIDVDRAMLWNFIYMGASMGVVALLATARLGSGTPNIGGNFELETLTAVIVGGVAYTGGYGRPMGVFFGVLLLGTVAAAMIFLGFSDDYQRIAKGAILLLALAADQYQRIRLRRTREKAGLDNTSSGAQPDLAEDHADTKGSNGDASPTPELRRGEVALTAEGLTLSYGAVQAVKEVSFKLHYGEITCLIGDNGAGKSSLVRMLAGVTKPDCGTIQFADADARTRGAMSVRRQGVETVWQDLALCDNLGVAYNLCLGREPTRFGPLKVFDVDRAEAMAIERLASVGVRIDDPFRPLAEFSGGQRQAVAISRVLEPGVRVVSLDEPTAALGVTQTKEVLDLIRRLADSGVAILLISHDIDIVESMADHYVILRRGELVADTNRKDMDTHTLLHLMAGQIARAGQDEPGRADEHGRREISTASRSSH